MRVQVQQKRKINYLSKGPIKSIGGKGLPAILIKEDDQMFYVVRWSDLAPEPKSVFVTIDIEMAQDFILKEIDRRNNEMC